MSRTHVWLSKQGRAAFEGHVAALQAMVSTPLRPCGPDAGAGPADVAADR